MVSITQEEVGSQNSKLKINVPVSEYEPLLDKSLKSVRKTVDLKGFRKGMVPVGLVKKMYGNQILAEELNKLINQEISKYITDNKLDILGTPIPIESDDQSITVEQLKDYEFTYEFGTAPSFEINPLNSSTSIAKYQIKVSKDDIDSETERLRKQAGEVKNPEGGIQEDDVLIGNFVELKDGEIKDGGILSEGTFPVDMLTKSGSDKLMKLTVGESVDLDVFETFDKSREEVVKHVLNQESEPEGMTTTFRFTLNKINRVELAEVNAAFFEKIFGKDQVKSEEEFNKRLEEEISKAYNREMENKLNNDLLQYFIDNTKVDLPDEFLKRWILRTNDKPITKEQVDSEYETFQRNLKWSLIVKKIKADKGIEVSDEEIVDHTKKMIMAQFGFGEDQENAEQITEWAKKVLENEEQKGKTYDQILTEKIFDVIKDTVTIKTKEVTLEEFKKLSE